MLQAHRKTLTTWECTGTIILVEELWAISVFAEIVLMTFLGGLRTLASAFWKQSLLMEAFRNQMTSHIDGYFCPSRSKEERPETEGALNGLLERYGNGQISLVIDELYYGPTLRARFTAKYSRMLTWIARKGNDASSVMQADSRKDKASA